VVDAGMREQFGDTVALSFDLGGWYPPQFRGRGATVYLRGSFDLECDFDVIGADLIQKMKDLREKAEGEERAVNEETAKLKADFNAGRIDRPTAERAVDRLIQQTMENRARNQAVLKQLEQEMTELIAFAERESNRAGPLLAKMPFEDGFILFTAFHNGKQRSRRQVDLLRHLVYTTVTARLEARTKEQLVEAGFTAARHDLVTRSPGSPERTGTYACSRPGPLRFALGFNGEGVRLRLDLTSPDGRTATHETTEPVVVEVPDAVAGDWTYTVTAARLPSDNFPFTITIAEN
jgi:hypothetical protein